MIDGDARAFIFLVMLKRDNPRGFIYKENIPLLPSTYKKSKSTVNRHLKFLKERKLVWVDGKGNLKLIDLHPDKNRFLRTKIDIHKNDTEKVIRTKLMAVILEGKLKQCQYMSRLKEDSVKMHEEGYRLQHFSYKQLKKKQAKHLPKFKSEENQQKAQEKLKATFNSELIISDDTIAKMLGVSRKTYNSTIKKDFKELGIIKWESKLIQLPFSAKLHEHLNVGFVHKGYVYKSQTSYFLQEKQREIVEYKPLRILRDIIPMSDPIFSDLTEEEKLYVGVYPLDKYLIQHPSEFPRAL